MKKFGLIMSIISIVIAFVGGLFALLLSHYSSALTAVGVILLLYALINTIVLIALYNKLVKYKNKVAEALALIDIQLKLRFDLVPNLVATVKGYAKHEQTLFAEVIELRNKAANETDEEKKLEEANKLLPKLKQTVFLAENYPQLKADKVFRQLMDDLEDIEDRIAAARRIYDSNVSLYNEAVQKFPDNIIADMFNFEKCELFKIDSAERLAPSVIFDKNGEMLNVD